MELVFFSEGVEWIQTAQDRGAFVNKMMDFQSHRSREFIEYLNDH
jgi:hypothetical protein